MISIVTAYYNRKKLFVSTLNSIKDQRVDFPVEVIAVDDGSDEEERLEDLIPEFPFLKIIRLEKKNKWYHNSCIPFNIGFRAAKGDKIIIQNPECLHFGNILHYTNEHLSDNNYLSFGCFSLDEATTGNFNILSKKDVQETVLAHSYAPKKDGALGWYNHSQYRPKAYHFCASITKKNLKKLGGFDEIFSLGIAYDDDEFIHRIKKMGLKINFIETEFVLHQNHYSHNSTSFENRGKKVELINKNFRLFQKITLQKGYKANLFSVLPIVSNPKLVSLEVEFWKSRIKIIKFIRGKIKQLNFIKAIYLGRVVRFQLRNPQNIPIIILNFNQLQFLREQVEFWLARGHRNLVIIDNFSTYPPLLKYYNQIKDKVTIERMDSNMGHMAFFKSKDLQKKYGKGFFVITDADIIPNINLPKHFMTILIRCLIKYNAQINKVGFALDIDDLPDTLIKREKILAIERSYYSEEVEKNKYLAKIDTTFALYKPINFSENSAGTGFYNAIRIAGDFKAKHMGWYVNMNNMNEEQKYYYQTSDPKVHSSK